MKPRTGSVLGLRMDRDVEILMDLALKRGKFKNPNRAANHYLRTILTPLFPSKRVTDIQRDMGVKAA